MAGGEAKPHEADHAKAAYVGRQHLQLFRHDISGMPGRHCNMPETLIGTETDNLVRVDQSYVFTDEEIQGREVRRTRDKKARSLRAKVGEAWDYDETCQWVTIASTSM